MLILTAGFCIFAMDFIVDIEKVLRNFNEDLIELRSHNWSISEQVNVTRKLIDCIRFHSEAKQLSFKVQL